LPLIIDAMSVRLSFRLRHEANALKIADGFNFNACFRAQISNSEHLHFSLEPIVTIAVILHIMDNKKPNKSGLFATGGTLTGLFAMIGASCCILPIMLVNLGVSSALVSHLGFFARYRTWFMALTICLIIGAFIYAYRSGRRPSRKALVFLSLAALLAIGSMILPYYEGDIQRWMKLR